VKSEGQKFAFRLETVAVSGKSTKSSGTVNDLMLKLTAAGTHSEPLTFSCSVYLMKT
jgi:hypothetical protein